MILHARAGVLDGIPGTLDGWDLTTGGTTVGLFLAGLVVVALCRPRVAFRVLAVLTLVAMATWALYLGGAPS